MRHTVLSSVWYDPPMPVKTVLDGKPPHCIGVVAISNADGTWHARIGYGFGDEQSISEDLVVSKGSKVEKEVACAYFPHLNPKKFKM